MRSDANPHLRKTLMAARLYIPPECYLATVAMSSLLVGLSVGSLLSAISLLILLQECSGALLIGVGTGIAATFLAWRILLWFPSLRAQERRHNIDATLPYAIRYLTTMSAAGIPPAACFRALGESRMYGESAAEARFISRETDIFGKDLTRAMRTAAEYTPSLRMKDFLQGSVAAISGGNSISQYFRTKNVQYMQENRQSQKDFLETLGLVSESYVTTLVAGSLFLLILEAVVSAMRGGQVPPILYIIIFVIVPLGSALVILIIKTLTPEM